MHIEKVLASIFRVEANPKGEFDVVCEVPVDGKPTMVRFSLVSADRHAADTMAVMFNRVVNGVSTEPS